MALHTELPIYRTGVLICGYTEGGVLYIRSSKMNCAEAFFLASKAAQWAQNGGVE